MPLQLALAALERVQIVAERECRGDVHRVGGKLLRDVDRSILASGLLQSPVQPLGRRANDMKVAVQVVGVQGGDREATLALPGVALN